MIAAARFPLRSDPANNQFERPSAQLRLLELPFPVVFASDPHRSSPVFGFQLRKGRQSSASGGISRHALKLRYDGYACRLEPIHVHQRVDGLL